MAEYVIHDENTLIVSLGNTSFVVVVNRNSLVTLIDGTNKVSALIRLDTVIGSSQDALSAKTLILERTANEAISALQPVYLDTVSTCRLADNSSLATGFVEGIALNGGVIGAKIKILVFGIVEDPSFAFSLNQMIFLGTSGTIITTQPPAGVLTRLGWGLGAGAIQIAIEKPIQL